MEVIRNKKILALIGIIALLLGTFLPYITLSLWGYSQSISLWGYWEGKVVLILTLANALFIFNDWIEKYLPQLFDNSVGKLVKKANNPKFSLIPTVLVAGFAVYMLININVDSEYLKYGLGFYLLWVGIIALVGHSIFYKKQNSEAINTVQPQIQQPVNNTMNVQPQMQQSMSNVNSPIVNMKYCPNCGKQVDINSETCLMCGNKF